MGSVGAMQAGDAANAEEEFHGKDYKQDELTPEGVEGLVPFVGSMDKVGAKFVGGALLSGMFYTGCRDIPTLWRKARFNKGSQAKLTESHPHDLFVINN